jgi:hypothetical protein
MKIQFFYEPQNCKFVRQLSTIITSPYNPCLGFSRDYWKGIIEEYSGKIGVNNEFGSGLP